MMNQAVHILICDDDQSICKKLQSEITAYGECFSSYTVESTGKAMEYIIKMDGCVDAIFLDIEFENNKDGLCFGKKLQNQFPNILIVYITSHIVYCEDIFAANPICFLVKPIQTEKLHNSLKIIKKRLVPQTSYITIKTTDKLLMVIDFNRLMYIESQNHKIIFNLSDGTQVLCRDKLDNIASCLPKSFIRCHKSFLLNPKYIRSFGKAEFILKCGKRIPCSDSFVSSAEYAYIEFCGETIK